MKNIQEIYEEAVRIRRHLHAYPELSEKEEQTAELICRTLDDYGIKYRKNIAGCGIVATIGKGNPCVGIRADIDALPVNENTGLEFASKVPNVMHACGHDMHTAILLGTGILLKEKETELLGSVKLIFQPAEETVGGARQMIEEGIAENPKIDRILGLHVDPDFEVGTIAYRSGAMNAAVKDFHMRIQGVQCHGAHPENGRDTIVAAADLIMNLQRIASRFTAATDPVVVSIGAVHGGTLNNVIPGETMLKGTVRALSTETMNEATEKLLQIVKGIEIAHEVKIKIEWDSNPFPPLINDEETIETIEKALEALIGKDKIIHMPQSSMGADDFAFFTEIIPGAYINLGCRNPGEKEAAPLHSEFFCPDEEALLTGIEAETEIVIALMEQIG